jgi:hypothetical protein
VLAILDARAAQREVTEADWQRLFATEGYVRLQKRERAMNRPFEDADFRTFVMSPELLAKREVLAKTVADWERADLTRAASLALAYLPPSAAITATIYPVIKPKTNSFVFERNAIFKYVEDEPRARFEATIAHELHHIGFGTGCGLDDDSGSKEIRKWTSAFGEGLATLAAAGGPSKPAQALAERDVREAWDRGIADYPTQFATVQQFFLDVLERRLTGADVDKHAFEFFGIVGPWYTVGWKMAVTIERELGRDAVIAAFCDQRTLMATYNRAAAAQAKRGGEVLPLWDERLIRAAASAHPRT